MHKGPWLFAKSLDSQSDLSICTRTVRKVGQQELCKLEQDCFQLDLQTVQVSANRHEQLLAW